MIFGSKKYFNYISTNINSQDNKYMYEDLYAVLHKDVFYMSEFTKVPEHDREAVFAKIASKVIFKLPLFVRTSADMTEAQRNSWLKSVVRSKVADYFRLEYKKHEYSTLEDIVENRETHLKYASEDNVGEMLKGREVYEAIVNSIKDVCSLNTTPDKIIAFFLNCYSCVCGSYRENGKPQQICDEFNGKTIEYAAKTMKSRIQAVVCVSIPDEAYSALDEKIRVGGYTGAEALFFLEPKKISDSVKWIRSKLNDKKGEIVGEPY